MLSMKTGINTESMCIPSGVQRLTQDTGNSTQHRPQDNQLISVDIALCFIYFILVDSLIKW